MSANWYTTVIQHDVRYNSCVRVDDVQLLEPVFRRKVLAVVADAHGVGWPLRVYETYRSQCRQTRLWAAGASMLKTVGVHHFGLACDLVVWDDGDWSWKGDFKLLGHLARSHNLVWGGDWGHPDTPTRFPDLDHVQNVTLGEQRSLFRGVWYPAADRTG